MIFNDDYYPFGLTFNSYKREFSKKNKMNTFQDQEYDEKTGWVQFKWRNHQPDLGRFFNMDPLAEDYYYNSPYAFSENKVVVHIELEGLESLYIFDQANNPNNKRVYTADVYVESKSGVISGPYSGSSYPNAPDSYNTQKTINSGTYDYNNTVGHDAGNQKGLNLRDSNGNRTTPAKNTPGNDDATAYYVNAHSGQEKNAAGLDNRGSAACITIDPADAESFFSNFDWSGSYNGSSGNTGTSEGEISVFRGDTQNSTVAKDDIDFKLWMQNYEIPSTNIESDNTRVQTKEVKLD